MSLLLRLGIETSYTAVKDEVDCFVFVRSHVQISVHRAVTATEIFGGILLTPPKIEGTLSENDQQIAIP
jgi:hypothetical protein